MNYRELSKLISYYRNELTKDEQYLVQRNLIDRYPEDGLCNFIDTLVEAVIEPLEKLDELEKQVNDNNIMLRNLCKHLGVSPY